MSSTQAFGIYFKGGDCKTSGVTPDHGSAPDDRHDVRRGERRGLEARSRPGWADGGVRALSGTYNNDTAGSIKRIRVDYYNRTDVGQIHLNWIRPGQPEENVPGQYLRPRYGLKTSSTASESDGLADKVGTTRFDQNGMDPVYGVATSGQVNPPG